MPGELSRAEVTRIVNRYIGVSGGYLGDFSYQTHADFYPEYCDLDIDPNEYSGTTRYRFIDILSSLTAADQAKVLRGVVRRFPPDGGPDSRKEEYEEMLRLIQRLEGGSLVAGVTPRITSDVVVRAIMDAESLINTSGSTSAVDRVHTQLHGYLMAVCEGAAIPYERCDSMVALLRKVRTGHPVLADLGTRGQDIERVLYAFGSVLDALLPVRNRASVAHPNSELLGDAEARLVINAVRTIVTYLDGKLS